MNYTTIVFTHLITVCAAFLLGTTMLVLKKGTPLHRMLGRSYLLLMLFTAGTALALPAQLGPTVLGHFGPIHLLCIVVAYSVPKGWLAARRGDWQTHRKVMVRLYVLALVVAGLFTLAPGRLIHSWVF
ncbi:DUF2306 domain-containing protein [Congregibacter litoralis]|uniref:Putative membrane protein n=1 Tax=Congregibacter litoralis KT71 TaxID=314285 RepID=A4A3H1_9GAMM|nr:DUF2306 domain-containing protein [Congregibacter litoralis]EAQ99244.2 putative membrane protein [Congregibacter litoralis KT71]